MNNDLKRQLQNRREAALKLPPLEHLPGDVRDPAQINLEPATFGLQQYRQWWLDNRDKPHVQHQIKTMVEAQGLIA